MPATADSVVKCSPDTEGKWATRFLFIKNTFQRHEKTLVRLAYLVVVAVFFSVFSSFYIPGKGFSYLVFLGSKQPAVISELGETNYYLHKNSYGYDGQFYAQIAVDPTLRNPELLESVDNLPYRGRRILMSLSAYLMGWGNPEAVLHAYTLQNVICWVLLAVLLLWWFPPNSWQNWFRWTGVLLCAGVWASMMYALTDGPSLLLVAFGVFLIEKNKPWLAAAVLGLSGLAKETNVLSVTPFLRHEALFKPRKWPKLILQSLLVLSPLALWIFYIEKVVGLAPSEGLNNFTWPFGGWAWRLKFNAVDAFSQDFFTRRGLPNLSFLCLLGLLALSVQCAFFLLRPKWDKPWWRIGASFSLLMIVLGEAVWEGFPGASYRVLLPMQLAFNVLVPRTRHWIPILIIGNLTLLTEIHVILDRTKEARSIARLGQSLPDHRRTRSSFFKEGLITVEFPSGWYGEEGSGRNKSVWSSGTAEVTLRNKLPTSETVALEFSIHSLEARDLTLRDASGEVLWHTDALKDKVRVTVEGITLKPGTTVLHFETSQDASFVPPDTRPLAFCVTNLHVLE